MSLSSGFEGRDLHSSGFGISALLKGSWDIVIGVIIKEAIVIITISPMILQAVQERFTIWELTSGIVGIECRFIGFRGWGFRVCRV